MDTGIILLGLALHAVIMVAGIAWFAKQIKKSLQK